MLKKSWDYISNVGALENESKSELRKVHLINRFCFIGVFTTFVFVPFMIFVMDAHFYPIIQTFAGLSCCLFLFFSSKRWYKLALYWIFSTILINVFFCSLELQGSGVEYFLIPLGLLPFVMEERLQVCYVVIFVSFVAFSLAYFLRKQYVPHEQIEDTRLVIAYLTVILSVFVICFIILLQFKTVYNSYERVIEKQKEEVETKNKEITDSIRYAKRIQSSLLPTEKYIQKNLKRLKDK